MIQRTPHPRAMSTDTAAAPPATTRRAVGLLGRVVDSFLHPSLYQDPDTLNRARILIGSMLTLTTGALGALIAVLLSNFQRHSDILASLVILPASAWFIYALIQLRTRGSYQLASHSTIFTIIGMIVGGICLSGGPSDSPVTQLLAIPPLTAYFFGGRPLGSKVVLLTLILLVTLILLQALGVPYYLQTVAEPERQSLLALVVTLQNLAVISMMAFIYEYTSAVLKRERDAEREKFIELSKTDPLTGLSNRRNLDSLLQERATRYDIDSPESHFALGYLDLDGFKPINDNHGHAAGDEVLRIISDRLRNTLRETDFVGRQGGDEFILILDQISDQTTLTLMANRLLETIAQPIATSAGEVGVTGSLGFALFPLDASNLEDLKRAADNAMYEAKRQRGTWRLFQPHLTAVEATA